MSYPPPRPFHNSIGLTMLRGKTNRGGTKTLFLYIYLPYPDLNRAWWVVFTSVVNNVFYIHRYRPSHRDTSRLKIPYYCNHYSRCVLVCIWCVLPWQWTNYQPWLISMPRPIVFGRFDYKRPKSGFCPTPTIAIFRRRKPSESWFSQLADHYYWVSFPTFIFSNVGMLRHIPFSGHIELLL